MPVETAVTPVDSATTPEPIQYDSWDDKGTPIVSKKTSSPTPQDSAPAPKDAVADSAPQKETADSASDSATDTPSKPHLKTKEDTDKRFREILDELKAVRLQNEELRKASATRETKQDSQPAPEVYKPLDEKEYFAANAKATYEDFVRAAAKHEAKWEVKQEIAAENQRRANAEAQRDLSVRVEDAKKRYPDYQQRIEPAVKALVEDQQIPYAVKAIVNDSPVFTDLIYVLAEPANLADLLQTAKTNPAAAIRKIVLTEQLVQAELAKAKDGKDAAEAKRDESGKFVKTEEKDAAADTKPRAPKPPAEVGGRGTPGDDPLVGAAKAGDFRAFEAEQNRRLRAGKS